MNPKANTYLLAFIAVMTVANTVLILTNNNDSGRVVEPLSENTALVQAANDHSQFEQAQPEINTPKPAAGPPTSMAFAETEFDFGKIRQNTENKHIFSFTNTGTNPLIIQDAKGSCGCTVPKYPKEPIAPGQTGEIEVVYSPGTQKGQQMKTVTLMANTEPEQTVLQIRADVEEGS